MAMLSSPQGMCTALLLLLLLSLLLFTPSSTSSPILSHLSTTVASDAAGGDRFGWSLASSGNLLVAGAVLDDGPFVDQGSASLFSCASLPCVQVAKLLANDSAQGDNFGQAVAISGSRVVVGAIFDDTGSINNHGSAHVFSCSSTSCTLQAKLVAPDFAANNQFGYAVATSGDLVAVGALNALSNQGAVYVFNCALLPASPCSLVAKLSVPSSSFFGNSLAMEGSTLLVGAFGTSSFQGRAHLFTCTATSCTLGATLTAPDAASSAQFGFAVALSGDLVVITANGLGSFMGAAYVFQCPSPSSCQFRTKLTASDAAASDYFGQSVALSNGVVVIGAYGDSTGALSFHGSAYVFDCLGFACSEVAKLTASDAASSDYLGASVAFLGGRVAAGSYGDTVAVKSGSVKWFDPTSVICSCSSEGSLGVTCDSSRQCLCKPGWNGLRCDQDINECELGNHNCAAIATCTNTEGSFSCACPSGFSGDGITCFDIDECSVSDNCHADATCSNTEGSFTCSCNPGFEGDGLSCQDIDECANGSNTCEANAQCSNLEGSYSCACNAGFSGDGFSCFDINECEDGTHNCASVGICTNSVGSFSCACPSGYLGDGISCADVDECASGASNCHADAICSNTEGSFTCACKPDFEGDGYTCIAPTPAPTTAPNPSACIPAVWTFRVSSSWPNGYQATLSFTTPVALYGWKLYFDLPSGSVSGLWNGDWAATSVSGASSSYVVISPSWNAIHPANDIISLGMTGTGSPLPPTNVTFCPLPAPALPPAPAPSGCAEVTSSSSSSSFNVAGSWPNGYQATLSITTPVALYGWTVFFDLPGGSVASLWSGQWAASASTYVVISPSWNAIYPANGVIQLGMTVNGDPATVRPTKVLFCPVAAPTKA